MAEKTGDWLEASNRWEVIALSSSFWQSLGKALGWLQDADECISADGHFYGWKIYARRFYDIILTTGSTKAFWDELLQPEEATTALGQHDEDEEGQIDEMRLND